MAGIFEVQWQRSWQEELLLQQVLRGPSIHNRSCDENRDAFPPGGAHLPFAAVLTQHTCIPNDLYSTLPLDEI